MRGTLIGLPINQDGTQLPLIDASGESTIGAGLSWKLPPEHAGARELLALTLILDSGQDCVFALREIRVRGDVVAKMPILPRRDANFMRKLQRDEGSTFVDLAKGPSYLSLELVGDSWQGLEITLRNTSGDGPRNGGRLPSGLAAKIIGVPVSFHGLLLCCAQ